MSSRTGQRGPLLSVVVVMFNMRREAPRTLFTLTPQFQNVAPHRYEVIVVDNGSVPALGEGTVAALCERFRHVRLDPAQPSPARALNYGASMARGTLLGFMIDGARMVSPGVVKYALTAAAAYANPVVSTLGFHLGPAAQQVSVLDGYDQQVEDRLLDSVDWRRNGYELFRIASLAKSSRHGWFAPITESNCVFVTRPTFEAIGGFDEAFDLPGGGYLNLDFYRRACEYPQTELVTLLGEGSFHQFHDGASTGAPSDAAGRADMRQQYHQIRGVDFSAPAVKSDYLGQMPSVALEHLPAPGRDA